MIRGLAAIAAAALTLLAISSCKTAPAYVALPTLNPGAAPPGEAATLRGTLVRSGACLALKGSGGGTTIIVWPRSAQARVGGNGNVIIVWPFRRTDPPIRTREDVELTGIIMTDDIAGFARIPGDPGCRGDRYLVVREAPAAPDGIFLPRLEPGANPPGEPVTLKGPLVRSGACLALGGNGTTIVVWPRAAQARVGGSGITIIVWPRSAQARVDGNGNTIVVWPFRRTDPPIRTGEEAELSGIIITTDDIAGFARIPDDPGCRGGRYLALRETRPNR